MRANLKQAAVVALLAVTGSPATAQTVEPTEQERADTRLDTGDLEAWLDGFVPYALRQGNIAGLVVSVVEDGEVVIEKGYGYADVAEEVPMDASRTVMKAASISKSFTATAIMQQVEQGRLELDRDVNDYLDFRISDAFGQPITLRHLLTHTAGFEEIAYKRYDPPRPLREHVLRPPERIYPPGEIPAYSNYGVNLAGYILERVTGQPIAEYIDEHILDPLEMDRSSFRLALPEALRPFEAPSYRVASEAPYPPEVILQMSPVDSPSAGLSTTADDMTRFMLAHLQEGRYGDRQILQPETVRLMHAPAFVPVEGVQPVALGLFRSDYKGHRVIGHSGDGEGYHTDMRLLPDAGIGIFTAANSDGSLQGIMPAAFILRNALFEQFVERYLPVQTIPPEPTVSTAGEHAQAAAGEHVWSRQQKGDFQEAFFLLARFLALNVSITAHEDGTISTPALVSFESGPPKRWREVAPWVWREVDGEDRLLMKVEDGEVQWFWVDSLPTFWVNLKVPERWSAGLHVPLLGVSTGILLLTVLLWPVAAIVRRRYGRTLQLDGREGLAYRGTRFAALLGVFYMLGWFVAMGADLASTVGAEPWIRLLQAVGLLTAAGAALAVWNAWLTLRSGGSNWSKARSVLLALGLLYVVWFSFAFHLISIRLN